MNKETYLKGTLQLEREARLLGPTQQLMAVMLNAEIVKVGADGLTPAQRSTVEAAAKRAA